MTDALRADDEPLFPSEPEPDPEDFFGEPLDFALADDEAGTGDFRLTRDAVEYVSKVREGVPEYSFLCPRIDLRAQTRSADGENWGRVVSFRDPDGREHRVPIAAADIIRDGGGEVLAHLASLGFRVPTDRKRKALLVDYLLDYPCPARVRSASRVGWQDDGAFVLPDRTFGGTADEETLWQPEGRTGHPYAERGTLEDWKERVAALCSGNTRLVFALSAAFAGPLLHPLTEESGGIHVRGPSSCGKTTALHVAASIWGRTIRSWRSTDNGLEGIAATHNDGLLCLDELGQADARAADAVAYMLGNGQGKARANRRGGARVATTWRVIFLSTGEVSLSDKLREAGRGRSTKAGQEVRLLDLPADAGAGLGAFEELNGASDPGAFADALKGAVAETHGTAGPAFLEALVAEDIDALRSDWRTFRDRFLTEALGDRADGQAKRGAGRFAIIAFAGELACRFGVLPWAQGEALKAALACFAAWRDARGGTGSVEARQAIERVQAAVTTQAARFQPWDDADCVPRDRLGFFRAGDEGGWFFHAAGLREILAGLDEEQALRSLEESGFLRTYAEGGSVRRKGKIRPPGSGRTERMAHILPTITGWGGDR